MQDLRGIWYTYITRGTIQVLLSFHLLSSQVCIFSTKITEFNYSYFVHHFRIRFVLHHQISESDVQYVLTCIEVFFILSLSLIHSSFFILFHLFSWFMQQAVTGIRSENGGKWRDYSGNIMILSLFYSIYISSLV